MNKKRNAKLSSPGVKPKKSLGQNFLMHQATADRIADVSEITSKDTVLEIGPGTGMLTRALLARASHVVALETDADLIPQLQETFKEEIAKKKLLLVHQDVRVYDAGKLKKDYTLVANIPYYITGEIIRQFLSEKHKPKSMTLLVQKEVAERIAREKKESLLSLAVKTYGIPKYRFTVSKGSFFPAPSVDSAVLSITNIKNPFKNSKEEERFFTILRLGFGHKRKQLLSNLEEAAPRAILEGVFEKIGIERKARAEDVPLEKWQALARAL